MAHQPVNVAFDENGRPFIILREQEQQERVHGLEAHKAHILAAKVSFLLSCPLPRSPRLCIVLHTAILLIYGAVSLGAKGSTRFLCSLSLVPSILLFPSFLLLIAIALSVRFDPAQPQNNII